MPSLNIRPILEPKTPGQAKYMEAIRNSDLTICDGIWGTGKTFCAIGMAVRDVLEKTSKRDKIIISRPGVYAGEDYGFRPGSIEEKTASFARPMYEALRFFCKSQEEYETVIKSKQIEMIPVGDMQGLSVKNGYMILDEAQNATRDQLETFLTRMDKNTKLVLVGSELQCYLPEGPQGWNFLRERLSGGGFRKGKVSVCKLGKSDIVRHDLIAEIFGRLYDDKEPVEETVDDEKEGPINWFDVFVREELEGY